jgi:archaellum biogenesis ATPase FlaH
MLQDYDVTFQKLIIRYFLQDPELYARASAIYNPKNFDKSLMLVAEFIKTYSEEYNSLPDVDMIKVATGVEISGIKIEDIESKKDWVLDNFEKFTRKQELTNAILKAAKYLEKDESNFDPIEKLIKDAVQISITRDLGTNYFEDPKKRLMALKESNGQISTGLRDLDSKLYGGVNRKELAIVCAPSGGGKSLFMQNMAVNWINAGMTGVYITLELREELCAMRMDSMISGIAAKDIFKEIDDVELKIKVAGKKMGELRIKFLPAQSNVNHIKAYLKELKIQTGMKLDFVCIDYLDLMMPASVKVDVSDVFIKDKYVAEELRNLAFEFNCIVLSACQLNREGGEQQEFSHSSIAGGISKIYTADNVFGLYTSRSMRERGIYQLQFLKTRNSGSVGDRIDLGFNLDTLRFGNADQDDSASTENPYLAKIKFNTSTMKNTDPSVVSTNMEDGSGNNLGISITPKPKNGLDPYKAGNDAIKNRNPAAEIQSNKLRNMLNDLKAGNK